jgi:hypothetical protein
MIRRCAVSSRQIEDTITSDNIFTTSGEQVSRGGTSSK